MSVMNRGRYIACVDMDAFFAAIEQRDNPGLVGKPVIVGADPKSGKGRGVVSTCSYEARKFGIHSAMPISIAYQKCPQAIFLPPDMEKYNRVSQQIYEIFETFTPIIEPLSIDEAFLDITQSYHLFGTPLHTLRLLKLKIKEETRLNCSVGLAPTKMAAKIASEIGKSNGLVEVIQERLLDFLWPLPVDKISGLGKKAKTILNRIGINTIGDLAKVAKEHIVELFGKNGEDFWLLAHGIDERAVEYLDTTKSISNETTFEKDTDNKKLIEATLLALCERVSSRLRKEGFKGRTITLKIRLEGFKTYSKAITLNAATNFTDIIYRQIKNLSAGLALKHGQRVDVKGKKIRLIGVKVSNLISCEVRDSIFVDEADQKRERIHKAIDEIKERFGSDIIHRAAVMHTDDLQG